MTCKCSEDAQPQAAALSEEETTMTIRRNAKAGEQVRYIGANIGYIRFTPKQTWNPF